ncbi:CHASE3 domain-containing protein [Scytonema sp. PRP1]|uniref:CHASE3 domain-containing protein n=1 Tax=Scytonema sp. PRP1 TaxID=3120513 RepID=UPI002FD240E9
MKRAIRKQLRAGFGMVLAVVVVNAVISYQNTLKVIENEYWVAHTHQVLTELENTLSTLKDAETGQRGYVLTGDKHYLEPYFAALSQINGNIKNIRQLTADNSSQQRRILSLERKVAEKLNELQKTIALRQEKGIEPAQQVVLSGRGKKLMDDIRRLITQMEKVENELLQQRSQESKASFQKMSATFFLATFLNLALLILLYYFISRNITQHQRGEEALRQSENHLRTIINAEPECVKLIEADGSILEINPAGLVMIEVESADSIIGKSIYSFVASKYTKAFQAFHESVCQGNKGTLEFEIIGCRGSHRWMETHSVPLCNQQDGKLLHLAIGRDITERKRAEKIQQKTQERLQILSQKLIEAQEAERRYIARELHDEIGQALTAVKINLQGVQHLSSKSEIALLLQESTSIVEVALQQVRSLSLDLRPSLLDDLGLVAALRWYVDRQSQRGGIIGEFVASPLERKLLPNLETTCFRIVQEALTNVVRHAQAQRVTVELRQQDAQLHLVINDDGIGFNVEAARERATHGGSLGLLGMEERALLVGSQFNIESVHQWGTKIHVCFPLQ